jgi:hypothetical protein
VQGLAVEHASTPLLELAIAKVRSEPRLVERQRHAAILPPPGEGREGRKE